MDLSGIFRVLLGGHSLAESDAESLFECLFQGQLGQEQIAAVLALIQSRGSSVDELVGAARAMRRHVTPVPIPASPAGMRQVVLDTCGTGGALKTFNISTAVAIVTAAASPHHTGGGLRVLVAKHGNRSRTGRGSAEVLGALGVNVDATPEVQCLCLQRSGVCFCFAIHHHHATKHASPARVALGFPTIFNLLGPLTNPARATRQLLGVYDTASVPTVGECLSRLGTEGAMVVHGAGGMDEISTLGLTTICHAGPAGVWLEQLDPASLGMSCSNADLLTVRDLDEAASRVREVIAGQTGPCRDIVLLNAAAALVVAGASVDLASGVASAACAIDSGRATSTLGELVSASHESA